MSGLGLPPTAIDELEIEQRKKVLLDLALLESPTLSMLAGEPPDEEVWVVDTIFDIGAGTRDEALQAYARSNSLDVTGPQEHWAVFISSYDSDPQTLASAETREEALRLMRQALTDLCGDRVTDLKTWAQAQAAESLEQMVLSVPKPDAPTKLSPFVTVERVELRALPLSKTSASRISDLTARKVRRKAAFQALKEPVSLGSRLAGSIISDWNIQVTVDVDEGVRYANHHDLLAAVRLGLDPQDVEPWPCDVAHKFLLTEEVRKAMRVRGFIEITDFDPDKMVHLRVSLPEFSSEITGVKEKKKRKETPQIKPAWPPSGEGRQRVVIVLDRARLAFDKEPEWETVSFRNIEQCTQRRWVEIDGPTERRRRPKPKAPPAPVVKAVSGAKAKNKAEKPARKATKKPATK